MAGQVASGDRLGARRNNDLGGFRPVLSDDCGPTASREGAPGYQCPAGAYQFAPEGQRPNSRRA